MFLTKWNIAENGYVHLWFSNGGYICVCLDEQSGKIITRNKVNGTIQHTGILLGKNCLNGQGYVIQNHPLLGYTHITTTEDYAQGQIIRLKETVCVNDPLTVLQIGLNHVLEKRKYRLLSDNCQTLVNTACSNRSYSEDVAKWGTLTVFGIFFIRAIRRAS